MKKAFFSLILVTEILLGPTFFVSMNLVIAQNDFPLSTKSNVTQTQFSTQFNVTMISNPFQDEGSQLTKVFMVSSQDGWAIGWNMILHWNGSIWQKVSSPVNYDFFSIFMLNANDGWIVGAAGTILRWNGVSWSKVPSPTGSILRSVYMVSPTDGWAVGDGGSFYNQVIIHWDGTSWNLISKTSDPGLQSVSMLSSTDGWAVGAGGTILHWNGRSWTKVSSPTHFQLTSVFMHDDNDGWAVGAWTTTNTTTMLRWDGTIWETVSTPGNTTLFSVLMLNQNDGWAVGEDLVLHWNGTIWTKMDVPLKNWNYISVYPTNSTEGWIVGSQWIEEGTMRVQQPRILKYVFNIPSPNPSTTPKPSLQQKSPSPTMLIPPNLTAPPTPTPTGTAIPSPANTPTSLQNLAAINFTVQCNTSYSNFTALLNGSLTADSTPLLGVPIDFAYTEDNGSSWNRLALSKTDRTGNFLLTWKPSANTSLAISARYEGNSSISRTETTLHLTTTPYQNQSVFSVVSNSVVNALSYDITNRQLSFNVNSASNSTKQFKAYMDRSLIENVSDITVYVDGNQEPHKTQLQENSVVVSFTHESENHNVIINLNNSKRGTFEIPVWIVLLLGTILALAIAFLIAIFDKIRERNSLKGGSNEIMLL